MPNQPPLNTDALEAAARTTYEMRNPESWAHSWEGLDPKEREEEWIKPARTVATAYLAAAQPVVQATSKPNQNLELVNRWQELRVLPIGSVVLDADDQLMRVVPRYGEGRNLFEVMGEEWAQDDRQVDLPARVLYRPEVKP